MFRLAQLVEQQKQQTTNKQLKQLKNQNFLPTEETRKSFRQKRSNKSIHQKTRKNFLVIINNLQWRNLRSC